MASKFSQHRSPMGDRYDEEILRFYKAGWSVNWIATRLGVSHTSVSTRLRAHHIEARTPSEHPTYLPHEEVYRTIFLYHECKLSLREVAKQLGLAQSTIHWRLVHAGAPPRSPAAARTLHRS